MRLPIRPIASLAVLLTIVAGAVPEMGARAPVYFSDDPIVVDPETQDASEVTPWEISGPYDFAENTFFKPGDRTPRRAMNTNTIDEVPDSSWFTTRGAERPLTAADVRRGPDVTGGPAPGTWTVISGKSDGITPGFTIRDTAGIVWFIKFDPISNPEMATGAEMVSTKLFWALGYHVPENHLATLVRDNLVIDPDATIRDIRGVRRALTQADLDRLLLLGAENDDDTYRVIASKALDGRPLGPFRYFGTRPDDPNDIFPHEHRRELRGMRVFAAWLNHDDSRSINTLDTLVERNGRKVVWHHLIDFGSTLGSGSVYAQKPRAGNEYLWEARPTIITALTLGLWVRPWIRVKYPDFKSLGNIESVFFRPEVWKPEYPNQAFERAGADDLFWAARRVMAVSDDAIRAAVETARFTEPGAADYLADVIIARRDKVGLAWLTHINPLVDFALSGDGVLTFRNVAADLKRAPPAAGYQIQWARFDNNTGRSTPVGSMDKVTDLSASAPKALLSEAFVEARVGARSEVHPSWAEPVTVRFRRMEHGWKLVGERRGGEPGPVGAAQ